VHLQGLLLIYGALEQPHSVLQSVQQEPTQLPLLIRVDAPAAAVRHLRLIHSQAAQFPETAPYARANQRNGVQALLSTLIYGAQVLQQNVLM
jgi:hypothetical protein